MSSWVFALVVIIISGCLTFEGCLQFWDHLNFWVVSIFLVIFIFVIGWVWVWHCSTEIRKTPQCGISQPSLSIATKDILLKRTYMRSPSSSEWEQHSKIAPMDFWQNSTPFFGEVLFCTTKIGSFRSPLDYIEKLQKKLHFYLNAEVSFW